MSYEQDRISNKWGAYTEVALIVQTQAESELLSERDICIRMTPESQRYVNQLGHGYDESRIEVFISFATFWGIVDYEPIEGRYSVGKGGKVLVENFLAGWQDTLPRA